MEEVSVRDFHNRVSELVRRVREDGESFVITYRGKPVARMEPAGPGTEKGEDPMSVWREMDELAEEIGRKWPKGVSAAKALSDDRR